MKTTANTLVGGIALAIVLSARIVAAGTLCDTPLWLSGAVLGQVASADVPTADRNQAAADLLRRARQAMAEDDLSSAESLVGRAEALNVTYSPLYMGDTPKKVRRDLERKRTSAPGKSSQLFSPLGANRNAPKTDPFAGRPAESNVPNANPNGAAPVTLLPKVSATGVASYNGNAEQRLPMQPPADAGYRMSEPQPNVGAPAPAQMASPNTSGNGMLREARLALAFGDVRRAGEFVARAKQTRFDYQPLDDTPDKVEAAVRKYQDLGALDKNSEAYRRAYARSLTEQADALLRWGEHNEAERLAGQAAGMRIAYGPFEQKPQELLERIAAARRAGPGNVTTPNPAAVRQQAVVLVRQARDAIAAGDLDRAEALARQAEQLRVPDAAYTPGDDRPGLVLLDLRQLRSSPSSGVVPAGGQFAAAPGDQNQMATRAVYDPAMDQTRNMQVASQQPGLGPDLRLAQTPARPLPPEPPVPSMEPQMPSAGKAPTQGMMLFSQGEAALRAKDTARAYDLFRQAATHMNELDAATAKRLQDNLQMLAAPTQPAAPPQPGQNGTMADQALARQQLAAKSVLSELAHKESNARALRETDPKAALAMLEEARKKVEMAGLDSATRDQLLRRVDRAIGETKQIIEHNRPQIELAEKNKQVTQDLQRQERLKVEVGEKLALMVDEYNKCMEDQRYEQAEIIAKQAADLDPRNPLVVQLQLQSKLMRNYSRQMEIKDLKERGFVKAMESVDEASEPFSDKNPMVFGDAKVWGKLTANRKKLISENRRQRTEAEIEIEKKLRTPVSLQFANAPLSKVLESLQKMADINMHLDPQGLAEEGVTTDTPVTIDLSKDIMLKSALHLILEPLHLNYVVKDEVLKITSEQMRDGQIYPVTYNVADLVIPIPNFVPTQMGLQSAYNGAMANVNSWPSAGMPLGAGSTATPMAVVATKDGGGSSAMVNSAMLAQQRLGSGAPAAAGGAANRSVPIGQGPGGLGGGAQADFDSLIELITTTVRPTSWDEVGGPGSIKQFETNLSLVISQTQDVHEEIEDLLQQLRRLQDLQVTIEVRFITLNDNFFERIGVSFDFDINDNVDNKGIWFGVRQAPNSGASASAATNQGAPRNYQDVDTNRTVTVGLSSPTTFSSDLDIPFTQNSFGLAVPQFGGFDATAGAQLGFAILSDIEAYFFINAAQGDRRSNVLQAPKVTLFNGQQAFVSDTSQSPFVISVIPVVGDFAAAQQPVIVVLSEGTFMTVQAVVSNDKRFVRLTVVPFFSKIGKVNTFQFTGSETTTTDTTRSGLQAGATDPTKLWNNKADNVTSTSSGTTVQLPTFSFVTVTTTVSVPDGGTVLLGGIKRLSEGRNEFGVPLLDKLPYINRLFKNVGIGRETQSLMMMVTPRIIIQEEEEEKLGVPQQP